MVIAALRTESEVKARCGIGTTVAIVTGGYKAECKGIQSGMQRIIRRNANVYEAECKGI